MERLAGPAPITCALLIRITHWLNVPALDRPLRFALAPFSASLEQAWTQAVNLIAGYARSGIPLPSSAIANLDEFLVSLVLSQHPHNYSDDLRRPQKGLPPRLIREAERLMRSAEPGLTPSKVAAELRVSLRTLELGFRAAHDCTMLEAERGVGIEHQPKRAEPGDRADSGCGGDRR